MKRTGPINIEREWPRPRQCHVCQVLAAALFVGGMLVLFGLLSKAHGQEWTEDYTTTWRVEPWYPNARIIHVPPGFIEPAKPAARLRWQARCNPKLYTDRNGVNRYVYSKPGCEFGPALEDGHGG